MQLTRKVPISPLTGGIGEAIDSTAGECGYICPGKVLRSSTQRSGHPWVYNRREPRGNGLKWMRYERRENTIEGSEFEMHLGPRKNGIDVHVTGIGEDVYKMRVPFTTLPHARDAQEPAQWTFDLVTISRLEGSAVDDDAETGKSDDSYPKEAIEVLKGMASSGKPGNTSMVEGDTLDLFDGQLPGI